MLSAGDGVFPSSWSMVRLLRWAADGAGVF